jgi:quinoprotein glucose dehydrogenase
LPKYNKKLYSILILSIILLIGLSLKYFSIQNAFNSDLSDSKWYRSGHNLESDKYSSLNQINKINIKNLQAAWTYHSGDITTTSLETSIQTNPIFTDHLIITTSPCCLIAIEPKNGTQIWKLNLPSPVGRRGITYFKENIYVPTSEGVFVVNEKTGKINKELGDNGKFGSELSVLPPIIAGEQLIIANFLGSVESRNIKTGKIIWQISLKKDNVISRLWSGMSYDEENKLIFLVTSASMDLFAKNYGDGGYSSSLLAINSESGKLIWNFQEIKKEIWDLDMVGAPILSSIKKMG